MKYKVNVIIADPNTEKGMTSDIPFVLNFDFVYDSEQYGNGYYVVITCNEYSRKFIDLRYDKNFDSAHPELWIKHWAYNYWTGKNGAWTLKKLKINSCGC